MLRKMRFLCALFDVRERIGEHRGMGSSMIDLYNTSWGSVTINTLCRLSLLVQRPCFMLCVFSVRIVCCATLILWTMKMPQSATPCLIAVSHLEELLSWENNDFEGDKPHMLSNLHQSYETSKDAIAYRVRHNTQKLLAALYRCRYISSVHNMERRREMGRIDQVVQHEKDSKGEVEDLGGREGTSKIQVRTLRFPYLIIRTKIHSSKVESLVD